MKIKNICCIGAGYVGGPTMAVIALKCPEINVTVVDLNKDKIDDWNGNINNLPVYEPGLKEIIAEVRGRNLFFSTEINTAIDKSEMIFMAVNTPTKRSGIGAGMAADLKYVRSCAKTIAIASNSNKIVVEKSTLPVRTAEEIKQILTLNNAKNIKFQVLSNPEFLAEGTAIQDLFKSDRVLIGGDNTPGGKEAVQSLVEIYSKWISREKILTTNVWSSELAKLASNAFLAQRISSINSLSALCEKTGANINEISNAVGMDHRIGPKFLKASVGFGGSCFQKDILNLVYLCSHYGLHEVAEYWHQVVKINDYQKKRFSKKVINYLNDSNNEKHVAILGWAFKANTKDTRESASIYIAQNLLNSGIDLNIFDPMVSSEQIKLDLKEVFQNSGKSEIEISKLLDNIMIFNSYEEAINNVAAICVLTEWEDFKNYDWNTINNMSKVFDGRNIVESAFYSIGR